MEMKRNSSKRIRILWCLTVALCFVFMSCAAYAASDSYYPGPSEGPEEPIEVLTPEPTPVPTPEPTPAPTPKPWTPPRTTPEPEPEPEEEEPIYTLTVVYRYTNGEEAAVTYVNQFREGESYEVISPEIPGYLVTKKVYAGTMSDRDQSFVVWYYREGYTILEDYDTPLGLGNVVINIGDCYE